MVEIAVGSKEYLLVKVADRLKNISTLDGRTITYDVQDRNGNPKYTNAPGENDVMTAKCFIDTTLGGNWTRGVYKLWVSIVIGSETPRLGPFDFNVV